MKNDGRSMNAKNRNALSSSLVYPRCTYEESSFKPSRNRSCWRPYLLLYVQVTDQISNILTFSISLHSIFHKVDMIFSKFFFKGDFLQLIYNKMVLVIEPYIK